MACLHLWRDVLDCAIYVDTGLAYPETKAMVEYAKDFLPVHVVETHRPDWIPSDVVPVDWTEFGQLCTGEKPSVIISYHECCYRTIAKPLLDKALELGVTELVYGQRNEESRKSPSRDGTIVSGIVRRHPIETWTEGEVFDYLKTKMDVPEHFKIKHSSLDCYDCTAYREDSKDRVAWMAEKHPEFHKAYLARSVKLNNAIVEAMGA